MEVDLHGFHPTRIITSGWLYKLVQQMWEMGEPSLTLIHGHGRNRGISPGFVNTRDLPPTANSQATNLLSQAYDYSSFIIAVMNAAFDLTNEDLRLSVAEAIAWCAGQQLTASIEEPEELRKRRMLVQEAAVLRTQAYSRYERFWNRLFRRDYRKSREWQLAMKLSREADVDSLKSPLAKQLRSSTLEPNSLIGENRNENERKALVLSLVQKRSELLRSRGQVTMAGPESKDDGRMLVYSPEENVADGASEGASGGFFDAYDAPPWDVWVAYSGHSLLAWVPSQLIGLAQSGIDVNPIDCIRWLN